MYIIGSSLVQCISIRTNTVSGFHNVITKIYNCPVCCLFFHEKHFHRLQFCTFVDWIEISIYNLYRCILLAINCKLYFDKATNLTSSTIAWHDTLMLDILTDSRSFLRRFNNSFLREVWSIAHSGVYPILPQNNAKNEPTWTWYENVL